MWIIIKLFSAVFLKWTYTVCFCWGSCFHCFVQFDLQPVFMLLSHDKLPHIKTSPVLLLSSQCSALLKGMSTVPESLIYSLQPAQVFPCHSLGFTSNCPVTSPLFEPPGSRVTVYFLTAYRDLLDGWKCTRQAFSAGSLTGCYYMWRKLNWWFVCWAKGWITCLVTAIGFMHDILCMIFLCYCCFVAFFKVAITERVGCNWTVVIVWIFL